MRGQAQLNSLLGLAGLQTADGNSGDGRSGLPDLGQGNKPDSCEALPEEQASQELAVASKRGASIPIGCSAWAKPG